MCLGMISSRDRCCFVRVGGVGFGRSLRYWRTEIEVLTGFCWDWWWWWFSKGMTEAMVRVFRSLGASVPLTQVVCWHVIVVFR